jgi:hypothetical protein
MLHLPLEWYIIRINVKMKCYIILGNVTLYYLMNTYECYIECMDVTMLWYMTLFVRRRLRWNTAILFSYLTRFRSTFIYTLCHLSSQIRQGINFSRHLELLSKGVVNVRYIFTVLVLSYLVFSCIP